MNNTSSNDVLFDSLIEELNLSDKNASQEQTIIVNIYKNINSLLAEKKSIRNVKKSIRDVKNLSHTQKRRGKEIIRNKIKKLYEDILFDILILKNIFNSTIDTQKNNKNDKNDYDLVLDYIKIDPNSALRKPYTLFPENPLLENNTQTQNNDIIVSNNEIKEQYLLLNSLVEYLFNKQKRNTCVLENSNQMTGGNFPMTGGNFPITKLLLVLSILYIPEINSSNIVETLTSPKYVQNVSPVINITNTEYIFCTFKNAYGSCLMLANLITKSPEKLKSFFSILENKNNILINSVNKSIDLQPSVGLPYGNITKVYTIEEDNANIPVIKAISEIEESNTSQKPILSNIRIERTIGPLEAKSFKARIIEGVKDNKGVSIPLNLKNFYLHYLILDAVDELRECFELPPSLTKKFNITDTQKFTMYHNFMKIMSEKHILNAFESAKTGLTKYKIGDYVLFIVGIPGHAETGVAVEVYKNGINGATEVKYGIIESNMLANLKAYETYRVIDFKDLVSSNSAITVEDGFVTPQIAAKFQKGVLNMLAPGKYPIETILSSPLSTNINVLRIEKPIPIVTERQPSLSIYQKTLDIEAFKNSVNEIYTKRMFVRKIMINAERELKVSNEIASNLVDIDFNNTLVDPLMINPFAKVTRVNESTTILNTNSGPNYPIPPKEHFPIYAQTWDWEGGDININFEGKKSNNMLEQLNNLSDYLSNNRLDITGGKTKTMKMMNKKRIKNEGLKTKKRRTAKRRRTTKRRRKTF